MDYVCNGYQISKETSENRISVLSAYANAFTDKEKVESEEEEQNNEL